LLAEVAIGLHHRHLAEGGEGQLGGEVHALLERRQHRLDKGLGEILYRRAVKAEGLQRLAEVVADGLQRLAEQTAGLVERTACSVRAIGRLALSRLVDGLRCRTEAQRIAAGTLLGQRSGTTLAAADLFGGAGWLAALDEAREAAGEVLQRGKHGSSSKA